MMTMNIIFMFMFRMRMGIDTINKAELKMYSQNGMVYENGHCRNYGNEEFCSFDSATQFPENTLSTDYTALYPRSNWLDNLNSQLKRIKDIVFLIQLLGTVARCQSPVALVGAVPAFACE
jgi:hypothetical protein